MTKTALELIQQGWTQNASARDKDGDPIGYKSNDAVCWCSRGAIGAAYEAEDERDLAIDRLKDVVGSKITSWNDKPGRTKEDVIEAFMKAGI